MVGCQHTGQRRCRVTRMQVHAGVSPAEAHHGGTRGAPPHRDTQVAQPIPTGDRDKSQLGAQAGAFLTVLPTERAYRLSDEQMRLALRNRLGMLPALSLRTESCLSCHARNIVHQPRFEDDPDHFQACIGKAPAGASVTSRHHRLAGELAHIARSVGYTVVREPPFGSIVVVSSSAPAPVTGENGKDEEEVELAEGSDIDVEQVRHDDQRGDLLLIRGDERLLIDVTIVRPTAPTNMRNRALAVTRRGLSCASAAERVKHRKYDALCAERGWKMVPFAIEAHGSLGKSARQLLHKLASKADEMSARGFLHQAYARLSIALHAANAAIAVGGMQRLRVDQLFGMCSEGGADLPMSPGLGAHRLVIASRVTSHRSAAVTRISVLPSMAHFDALTRWPRRPVRAAASASAPAVRAYLISHVEQQQHRIANQALSPSIAVL